MTLKLQIELKKLTDYIVTNYDNIMQLSGELQEFMELPADKSTWLTDKKKSFEIRLAWHIMDGYSHDLTGNCYNLACQWYDKYNCNDNHIQALLLHAMRTTGIIE